LGGFMSIVKEMLERINGIRVSIQKYEYGRIDEIQIEAGDIAKAVLYYYNLSECNNPISLSDFDPAEAGIKPVYPISFVKCIGVLYGKHVCVVGKYVPCHYQRNPEDILEFEIKVVDDCWQLRKSLKI
jgi:hypothetical protein